MKNLIHPIKTPETFFEDVSMCPIPMLEQVHSQMRRVDENRILDPYKKNKKG